MCFIRSYSMGTLRERLGESLYMQIDKIYGKTYGDYEEFLSRLDVHLDILLLERGVAIDDVCEAFPSPVIAPEPVVERDGNGDELEDPLLFPVTEPSLLEKVTSKGWIDAEREKSLLESAYYVTLKKNVKEASAIHANVAQNAIHILGRCTDPEAWDTDRQGLVMGMVQSGKTLSMLTVMALAMKAGYNLFIVHTGTTETLREQTQARINEAFGLNTVGSTHVNGEGTSIISPTHANGYTNLKSGGVSVFIPRQPKSGQSPIIIITILKQPDNLRKINGDLDEVRRFCSREDIDFDERYKALILDDEADNASLNVSGKDDRLTTINALLVRLRKNIPRNCYIGYTATPQGCIAASSADMVGYPKDFIWLLEPMKTPGTQENISYMGLHEFFLLYESELTKTLSPDAWPHYRKDLRGKSEGVYDPLTKTTQEVGSKGGLATVERAFARHLLETHRFPQEFKDAMAELIIGCGIRWYRHKVHFYLMDDMPDLETVIKSYPYHAMMFNLSLRTDNQRKTREFLSKCWNEVKSSFRHWLNGPEPLFDRLWEAQREKTGRLRREDDLEDLETIKVFMGLAVQITSMGIPEQDDEFIYMLNSSNEADSLNYDDPDTAFRTKKCAIFLGGNILSRGLTINNLSVSVFVRTQTLSLGDTNLQMCRWFGHKRQDADLVSLYLMKGSKRLFKDITKCDDGLRASIKQCIIEGKRPDEVRIELWSSNLFNVTSRLKAKKLSKQEFSAVSYTGTVKILHDPFCNRETSKLAAVTRKFEAFMSDVPCKKITKGHLNRGTLFEDVDQRQFRRFLKSLSEIPDDSLYVTPVGYARYLDDWETWNAQYKTQAGIPRINIGFMSTGSVSERQRDYGSSPKDVTEAKSDIPWKIGRLLGGPRSGNTTYMGDRFFDYDQAWHDSNFGTMRSSDRSAQDPILMLFYLIDPNYLFRFGSGMKARLEKGDDGYLPLEKILTMAVVTPLGGPKYNVYTNETIMP